MKWIKNFKGQSNDQIRPWSLLNHVMNIQNHQDFVRWYIKPEFDAWFQTYSFPHVQNGTSFLLYNIK